METEEDMREKPTGKLLHKTGKTTTDNGRPEKDRYKRFKIKNKILVEPDMFYSEAFMGLPASAIRTLMRCLQKRKWEKQKVNGRKQIVFKDEDFLFPYVEAAFLGIGTTQHWKNMKMLVERGFLDLVHQGGWYQGNSRDMEKDYSRYRLSDRWRYFGTPQFEKKDKPKVLQPEFYVRENVARKELKATSLKRRGHLHHSEVDTPKVSNDRLHDSEVGSREQIVTKRLVTAMEGGFSDDNPEYCSTLSLQ